MSTTLPLPLPLGPARARPALAPAHPRLALLPSLPSSASSSSVASVAAAPHQGAQEQTRTCTSCDVQWHSTETACWCCGRQAPLALPSGPSRDAATHTAPAPGEAERRDQVRLTRWGADVHRLMALGLPDPRTAHLRA